jgi:hypothetical protein
MGGDPAMQRGAQLRRGGLEAAAGQRRQALGVGLASDQRLQDGPAADPEDVGEEAGQLEVGVLQRLLDPQGVLRRLADQLLARAREIAQLLNGAGGTKLPRMRPWARQSAIQVASLTSLLRPGTVRTCRAWARTNVKLPPPYGILGRGMETSASCEARSAPSPYPTSGRLAVGRTG